MFFFLHLPFSLFPIKYQGGKDGAVVNVNVYLVLNSPVV